MTTHPVGLTGILTSEKVLLNTKIDFFEKVAYSIDALIIPYVAIVSHTKFLRWEISVNTFVTSYDNSSTMHSANMGNPDLVPNLHVYVAVPHATVRGYFSIVCRFHLAQFRQLITGI